MTHTDSPSGAQQANLASEANSAKASARLCQACGLCCSGALFAYVEVKVGDKEGLVGTPIRPYRTAQKKRVFDLPCPALEGTRCSIYARRPQTCRTYLCSLTRSVLNGALAYDDAAAQVAALKERGAWLAANIPPRIAARLERGAGLQTTGAARTTAAARQTLAAWQEGGNTQESGNTGAPAPASVTPPGIAVLLTRLYSLFEEQQAARALTEADQAFIAASFGYAKAADRHFGKTPLLRLYGELAGRL